MNRLTHLYWILFVIISFVPGVRVAAHVNTGSILCQYWRDVPGEKVGDLTDFPRYPNLPNEQVYLQSFEIEQGQPGAMGVIIRGYVHPPADGTYSFHISGSGEGQVWLGDGTIVAEIPKTMVAHLPTASAPGDFAACTSTPVELQQGRAYYIEARFKGGSENNHLAVGWKLPDGTVESPIPGSRLSPGRQVIVPPPRIVLGIVPYRPGDHRITYRTHFLGETTEGTFRILLPEGYSRVNKHPGMVFMPDPDDPIDIAMVMPVDLRELRGIVVIVPELPAGSSLDCQVTRVGLAVALKDLIKRLDLDRGHVGLTGAGAGGAAAWRLAAEMAGTITGFSPVGAGVPDDAKLKAAIGDTQVWIYSADDVDASSVGSSAQVIRLSPAEGAGASAVQTVYASADFYRQLLSLEGEPARATGGRWALWAGGGLAALVAAAFVIWRVARG